MSVKNRRCVFPEHKIQKFNSFCAALCINIFYLTKIINIDINVLFCINAIIIMENRSSKKWWQCEINHRRWNASNSGHYRSQRTKIGSKNYQHKCTPSFSKHDLTQRATQLFASDLKIFLSKKSVVECPMLSTERWTVISL